MRLDFTRKALVYKFLEMTTEDIVIWLEDNGLQLTKEKPVPACGIYRRELGSDLVYANGCGGWASVEGDLDGKISWACFDSEDWWVMVLDSTNRPVVDGAQFLMNGDGDIVDVRG